MASLPSLNPSSRWKLFPIEENGKRPITANGFKDASNDPAQLQLWATQHPSCNWAVATGEASGVFVVDVDGEIGTASLVAMMKQGLTLPPTLTATTGRLDGGWHIYFATPVGITVSSSTGKIGNGLDVKANGGYVVIPPSVHASGKQYTFIDPNAPIAEVPAWLLERLTSPILHTSLPISSTPLREPTERERTYASKVLRDEVAKLSATTSGRNAALNTAALHLGEMVAAGWITRSEVEQALWGAAFTNGYRSKDGDSEAWNTLQSGLTSGLKNPRQPLPLDLPLPFNPNTFRIDNVPLSLTPPTNTTVEIISMSDIPFENIAWLWNGFLAKGKLTLLAGESGIGKSTLAFDFAATVSNGTIWPDGTWCQAGKVLIYSTEDDAPTTIKPRLIAKNAHLQNIKLIPHDGRFNPATDMHKLRDTAISIGGVNLIIIDPITCAVTGDINKSNEVRKGLEACVQVARELNCALLGITHFTKNSYGRSPVDRVIGSQGFSAYARMTLTAARHEKTGNGVFTRANSNIAQTGGGFAYTLDRIPLSPYTENPQIVIWGERLTGTAREIITSVEHKDDEATEAVRTDLDEAKQFLIEELKDGKHRFQKQLVEEGKSRFGISEKTLQTARKKLGVTTRKTSITGGWEWSLAPIPPNTTIQ